MIQMRLDEPRLFYAYSRAQALVFPSLAEGFGLPTVEAMSMGCVPVLSDIACFREIGSDGALYFPTSDAHACAEQLKRVMNDEVLRKELAANGRKQLSRFDWKNTAQQTLKVYQELV